MSEQEQFPVGARVRLAVMHPKRLGFVRRAVIDTTASGEFQRRYVLWDNDMEGWHDLEDLVACEDTSAPEPPRAPTRTLAPGVEQSDDVCDGRPRIAGTGISTQALYAFWNEARIDWPDIKNSYDVTAEQHHLAIAFEAGRAWERERRRRRKWRRAVKRWLRVKALAEGKVDDRG